MYPTNRGFKLGKYQTYKGGHKQGHKVFAINFPQGGY